MADAAAELATDPMVIRRVVLRQAAASVLVAQSHPLCSALCGHRRPPVLLLPCFPHMPRLRRRQARSPAAASLAAAGGPTPAACASNPQRLWLRMPYVPKMVPARVSKASLWERQAPGSHGFTRGGPCGRAPRRCLPMHTRRVGWRCAWAGAGARVPRAACQCCDFSAKRRSANADTTACKLWRSCILHSRCPNDASPSIGAKPSRRPPTTFVERVPPASYGTSVL